MALFGFWNKPANHGRGRGWWEFTVRMIRLTMPRMLLLIAVELAALMWMTGQGHGQDTPRTAPSGQSGQSSAHLYLDAQAAAILRTWVRELSSCSR